MMYITSDAHAMAVLTALRDIANRAGSPMMQYSLEYQLKEQRESLNWIAEKAATAIQILQDKGTL